MPSDTHSNRDDDPVGAPVRIRLEIEPHPEVGCGVVGDSTHATGVTRHVSGGGCQDDDCGTCHAEMTVSDGTESETSYVRTPVSERCVCTVFDRHDCVPIVTGVRDGRLIVSLRLEDRAALRPIVAGLTGTGASVSVRRISRIGEGSGSGSLEVDATDVTPKQREAVTVAIETGYYDRPRGADLEELAERLGVSKSAVSQRLNAVEATLVRSLADETSR